MVGHNHENGVFLPEPSKIRKEVPQLVAVLKEMKEGLEVVTSKVQALTAKVKAKQFPTADGVSYLEAKHLLLVNYCQSLVYYLLRKAKGLSIEGHPVVRSLVEIRLFLEKIRPIDKKCGYRFDRLITSASTDGVKADVTEHVGGSTQKSEDLLKCRPNPDMLVSKIPEMDTDDHGGIYRPPKIAPVTMEDKKSKQEKDAERKTKNTLRRVRQSEYVRSLVDDLEGRPEEVKDSIGAGSESRELSKFAEKWQKREEQEEEIFNRAPITKAEKKKTKQLMRSNGLQGLTDDFFDEIKGLEFGDDGDEQNTTGFGSVRSMGRKHKRQRRKY
ncbi:neuroguidin-like [Chenopodium quinoa]|uniref:neuroguidin-like n=1 Tax=Chenopodium quinoa TaxID=63459 RepID=UPI000B77C78B|nr:neuroguidin-like [Chenopodium quinoa]